MDNQQRFNIKQVASVLNMEPSAIRHLAKSGSIGCEKHGSNTLRFTQGDVNDYVERNRNVFKKPLAEYEMKKPAPQIGKMPLASDVYAYTVDEVSKLSGLSPWSVRNAERNGVLESKRANHRVMFDRDYIDGLVDSGFFEEMAKKSSPRTAAVPTGKMSLGEASDYIGISYFTLRQMSLDGSIPSIELPSGKRVFDKSDLDDYIEDSGVLLVPGVHWHDCKKIKDAAEELGIGIKELDRLCDDNRIGYVRSFFGKRMLRPEDIETYRTGIAPNGYATQHSCEGGRLPSCIGNGTEKPRTPEQEEAKRERAAARAEKRAEIHVTRYREFEERANEKRETREQAKRERLESLVVSGITAMGNVVRFDLSGSATAFGENAVSDAALEKDILDGVKCQLTLAFPMDVECVTADSYSAATRSLYENGDAPALVILDENSMATAGDVTAAMCAASKHAVRYYINDYFKLPANAIEMSCDFYGQQVEEQQPEQHEETEQQIDGELDRIAMGDNGAVFNMVGGMSEPTLV